MSGLLGIITSSRVVEAGVTRVGLSASCVSLLLAVVRESLQLGGLGADAEAA